jgi:hypothetical protein
MYHFAEYHMQSINTLSIILLSIIMQSVITLNVIVPLIPLIHHGKNYDGKKVYSASPGPFHHPV